MTTYEVADRVATITLSRPERLNAWTGRMQTEYRWCLAQAAGDDDGPGHRRDRGGAGVLRGCGRDRARGPRRARRLRRGRPARTWPCPATASTSGSTRTSPTTSGSPKPIVAAINGPAAGVGFALACYCDVRLAAAGAKLTTAHGRLGLPAEFGLSWLLPRLIGAARAADLLLSSRACSSPRRPSRSASSPRVVERGRARRRRRAPTLTTLATRSRRRRSRPRSASSTSTCTAASAESIAEADRLLRDDDAERGVRRGGGGAAREAAALVLSTGRRRAPRC